jgi:hypothetical protein
LNLPEVGPFLLDLASPTPSVPARLIDGVRQPSFAQPPARATGASCAVLAAWWTIEDGSDGKHDRQPAIARARNLMSV